MDAPFWECVSGPVHSGSFGPGGLDNTFGVNQRYYKGPKAGEPQNQPPTVGLQFFGHVASEVMTVTLRDVEDANLFEVKLEPKVG